MRLLRGALMLACLPRLLSLSPFSILAVPALLVLLAWSLRHASAAGRHLYAALAALLMADIGALVSMRMPPLELPITIAFAVLTYMCFVRLVSQRSSR